MKNQKNIGTIVNLIILLLVVSFSFTIISCGEANKQNAEENTPAVTKQENPNGLTDFEMENGIGPVKEKLQLGAIDNALAKKGEDIFTAKCSACHKLDERYVGPAQRDVIERRTPEYIMNMILNPDEMIKRHPEAKKMLAQFMTPMANQNLSFEEARAVLEYFRKIDKEKQ